MDARFMSVSKLRPSRSRSCRTIPSRSLAASNISRTSSELITHSAAQCSHRAVTPAENLADDGLSGDSGEEVCDTDGDLDGGGSSSPEPESEPTPEPEPTPVPW
jgi:hypothetical protein